MKFTKMQGLGNDFVMIDGFNEMIDGDLTSLAGRVCHRRFGIGADGLILILPSDVADVKMRIFNSDGSEAEMCGNGIRCLAKYVFEQNLVKKVDLTVETLAGIIKPQLILRNDRITAVKVDMGEPMLRPETIPMQGFGERVVGHKLALDGKTLTITALSMGNPHCVIFVDDLATTPVTSLGPKLENHSVFPAKVNVEFVKVNSGKEMTMRVWERGAGETLACGTGACAVGVAGVLNGLTERKVLVNLLGGVLEIEWAENNHVLMTGPAEKVFVGQYL